MKKLIIVGAGGLARELTNWCAGFFDIVGYASNDKPEYRNSDLPDVLDVEEITPDSVRADHALIAIGLSDAKEKIYLRLKAAGFIFPVFIHPSSVVANDVSMDEGVVVAPNCVIGPRVSLGKSVYMNFSCGIGHDAQIGDFVQINPGAQIGGRTNIGRKTLIGSGATIIERVTVGENATVGSGSVCFGKVQGGTTVMGNPARKMSLFEKNQQ